MENKIASMLLPKLMSINSANFDFPACNFTEKNMYLKDRHTGAGREGSGRVSAYKATGLVQSYTLECNFNTGRVVNCVPMASRDSGRATPPPPGTSNPDNPSIPKYSTDIYEDAGKAMAISILDMTEINPWTRLTCSACKNIKGVKEWLRKYIRHSEEQHQKASRSGGDKTPSKCVGNYYAHGTSSIVASPVRSLRSGSTPSRRIRTSSASSLSGNVTVNMHNSSVSANTHSVSKAIRASNSKKASRGSGPGSPGSYRPVSKIARKNSLNQQQSQSPSNFRLDLASLPTTVDINIPAENKCRPKFSRSKSLTAGLTSQGESIITRINPKSVVKPTQSLTLDRQSPNASNVTPSKAKKTGFSRSRSRSKGRASKATTQQRSSIDIHEIPTMKWAHNGTLITHPLPTHTKKSVTSKKRGSNASLKKRRVTSLEKSISSTSIAVGDYSSRGHSLGRKNAPRKGSNASSTSSAAASITNIRAATSIDVEKQILSLTGGSHSPESSMYGSLASSSLKVSTTSSVSSGIGSSLTYNSTPITTPKGVALSKKRRTKRKKPL